MEVCLLRKFEILLENIILTIVCVTVVFGSGFGDGNVI